MFFINFIMRVISGIYELFIIISMRNNPAPVTPTKQLGSQPIEISYSDDFDDLTGNLIKVNKQLIQYLQQNESLIVEGDAEDQFLFNIENNSYKMRGVFLPTTMLATKQFENNQYGMQNKNTSHKKWEQDEVSHRQIAKVLLETGNYLKIQPHCIEYHKIYAQLLNMSIDLQQLQKIQTTLDLLLSFGLSLSSINKKFKITKNQFQLISKHAPIAVFHPKQIENLQTATSLIISYSAIIGLFRNLLPFLTERCLLGQWFTYKDINQLVTIKHQKIWMVVCKILQIETNFSQQQSYNMDQKMDIQGQQKQYQYKVGLTTLIHFILLELALAKNQYTIQEMNTLINRMLNLYLPVGIEQFEEEKAIQKMDELVGYHFLTVEKGHMTTRIYYDPLLVDSTVRGRLMFMLSFKKKFAISQIKGMFSRLATRQLININDVLMKNFRKNGINYEIKLIIPAK